jgi:hypothetical protein
MGHELLVYADYVNLLRDNTDTTKKNIETLTDTSKEVGAEVNAELTKYMLLRNLVTKQLLVTQQSKEHVTW